MRMRTGSDASQVITPVRIAILVAIACTVAATVWIVAVTRTGNSGNTERTSPDDSRPMTNDTPVEHVSPDKAPASGVVIPTGTEQIDGHPTEFPATDLGAVALQVEVARAQVGFDADEAVTIAGLYATPKDRSVFEERARAAVELRRRQAGVSTYGPVPAPASYAVTPVAYTVEPLDTGTYAVNLLSYVSLTTVHGNAKDTFYAGTQLLRWIDGDWRLVPGDESEIKHLVSDGQPPAAAPGTPAFAKAGWIRINGAPQ